MLTSVDITGSMIFGNAFGYVDNNNLQTNLQPEKIKSVNHRHLYVNLEESVGVSETKGSPNNDQSSSQSTSSTNKQANLSEIITISTSIENKNTVYSIKENYQAVTTLDRITNSPKIRSNSKTLVIDDNQFGDKNFAYQLSDLVKEQKIFSFGNTNEILKNGQDNLMSLPIIAYSEASVFFNLASNQFASLASQSDSIVEASTQLAHYSFNEKNPTLLLVLVPLSGYILARSEGQKFVFFKTQKFAAYCFLFILVSSMVVSPLSISPLTIANAFAMEGNDSSSQNPSGLSSNSTGSNTTGLSFNQFSNATQVVSNSTGSNNTSLSFNQFSNATQIVINSTGSNTTSLSFNQFSNATSVNDTEPIPSKSWNFTDVKTTIEQTLDNNTGLNLDGNKFLKENIASTQNLTALTLSAWVKPDYSQGSPQFTIISKENSFILGINNNIQPSKKAVFSVFDGIKWNTVTSNSTIPENWTHIAATYDGSSIGIYVNGTQESKIPLVGVSKISITGKIENQTIGLLSSNSDVVIGAYVNGIRDNTNNLFSGSIQDVKLYGSLLSSYQINQLYLSDKQFSPVAENSLPSLATNSTVTAQAHTSSLPENLSMVDAIQQLLNSTSITSINDTNSTGINDTSSLPVVPTITNLKKSYMMSENPEFEFKIFKDSDIKKIKKTVTQSMQQDKWSEKNTNISIKIIAPDGTEIPIKSQFKKIKEGQFDIKLLSGRYGKP